jgi:predicted AAA+ superfamily ATPase
VRERDVKTIKTWLSVMEFSVLVYLLEPYFGTFNRHLVKNPKIHFLDTGLACWLLGWNSPEQLVNGKMWGQIFESFGFAEILNSYYNDGIVNPPLYYCQGEGQIEIKASNDPKNPWSMHLAISRKSLARNKALALSYVLQTNIYL